MTFDLSGTVAVVAGATRGAGRGIAIEQRPEAIDETADHSPRANFARPGERAEAVAVGGAGGAR